MYIKITRSSVCAADDIDFPHEKIIWNIEGKLIQDILYYIRDDYLPRNVSGGSTWIIKYDKYEIGIIEYPSAKIYSFYPPEISATNILKHKDNIHALCLEDKSANKWLIKNKRNTFFI
jgi:hypothetical protein